MLGLDYITYSNSIKCDGFFAKDKMEGEGTLYYEDGSYCCNPQ